ncbi:hypothetical protein F5Y13DRAFT_194602 [Hypoxylon sp. FL1857]|nr:hypothetical protein F5Y13DRAFT_194602 [Hypoxylon sp. FL1857]
MHSKPLNPASAPFEPRANRSAAPSYSIVALNAARRNISSGPPPITDEDGIIVYDTNKANLLRNGALVFPVNDAATRGRHVPRQYPRRSRRQRFGNYGSNNPELASAKFGEWYDVGGVPRSTNGFAPSQPGGMNGFNGFAPSMPRSMNTFTPGQPSGGGSSRHSYTRDLNPGWSQMQQHNTLAEEDRRHWEQIKYNMLQNGLYWSPFVPRTYEEYVSLKDQMAAAKRRAVLKRTLDRQRDFAQTDRLDRVESQIRRHQREPVRISEKLARIAHHNLTTVNGGHTIWCEHSNTAGWPSPEDYAK